MGDEKSRKLSAGIIVSDTTHYEPKEASAMFSHFLRQWIGHPFHASKDKWDDVSSTKYTIEGNSDGRDTYPDVYVFDSPQSYSEWSKGKSIIGLCGHPNGVLKGSKVISFCGDQRQGLPKDYAALDLKQLVERFYEKYLWGESNAGGMAEGKQVETRLIFDNGGALMDGSTPRESIPKYLEFMNS